MAVHFTRESASHELKLDNVATSLSLIVSNLLVRDLYLVAIQALKTREILDLIS